MFSGFFKPIFFNMILFFQIYRRYGKLNIFTKAKIWVFLISKNNFFSFSHSNEQMFNLKLVSSLPNCTGQSTVRYHQTCTVPACPVADATDNGCCPAVSAPVIDPPLTYEGVPHSWCWYCCWAEHITVHLPRPMWTGQGWASNSGLSSGRALWFSGFFILTKILLHPTPAPPA